ncbi:MAG: hypothetical protein UT55_C0009G0026 [Candidatus Peregrinibacteria bacterium GW2011_GWE2_39_6]|nr:MAG: hypothetical protein UT36_C0014G0024 [Candidatus Peregrinibacteria bacterium GW2011_GWF2_39_17]KKR26394.1 MAG: hypothetical protein UT55_C0009G0026 [Candidatus Peregrinibacteria bacterium GW2011_GWE2_39_6]HCW32540.1 hypothetical protein [Candidatus Peregrinibacteria bacterium]
MEKICKKTGQPFTISEAEMKLRGKMGIEGEPHYSPAYRFMQLGAFWQHWHLHERPCDKTGKNIISVFSKNCPYPVWHRDEWVKNANPPGATFDPEKPLFEQMWDFFQKSPIAHSMVGGNDNSEYTDDWWYSKNCYLCHSGLENQDLKYCYRALYCKDSHFLTFSNTSELCVDITYCFNCFHLIYGFMCQQCSDSYFLFDCRNCQYCLFCSNLRNKQYCLFNQQLTKEEWEKKRKEFDFGKRSFYEKAKKMFQAMMLQQAWLRAAIVDKCDNVSGNFLEQCKNCHNCYLITGPSEDCVNVARQGGGAKDTLDCLSAAINTELAYYCSLAQDQCYDNKFCYNTIQCKYAEYAAHCFQCDHIWGCCGLVGKKYHIFNKPYSPQEYEQLKGEIIAKMKQTGEYGEFFPGYFAANPYDESWAYMYWPLSDEKQREYGFRLNPKKEKRVSHYLDVSHIPDSSHEANDAVTKEVFWDDVAEKPFQIQKNDITFCQRLNVPLPYTQYARRLQENFKWIPFDGTMRSVFCAKCHIAVQTGWPKSYDKRILCEKCYQQEVY